jgi:TolB-like protein
VVLYELLAGRTPFRQDTQAATLQSIIQDEPQPLARYRSDVPDTLQQIVSKLLAKNPQFRYQTADGVLPDLRSLSAGYSAGISTPVRPARRSRIPAVGAVIGILGVLAIAAFIFQPWKTKSTEHNVPMIAVLPFENLGSANDEYFADGMTEEITSRLATIEGLGVISRTSAVAAKAPGKTVNQIGKELGVDYILEGTVRWSKSGGLLKVRITPQLIRVSDDRHLWADNYERELMEVFDVQADIALQIVDQLGVTLLDHERQDLVSQPTQNAQAYEYYLRGVADLKRLGYRQEMASNTIASFDSAVALDSSFALAYAFKSIAHSLYYFSEFEDFPAHGELARKGAEKALQLSPGLSYAHLAMGQYFNYVRRDYDRALGEFSKAQSELHNNSDLLQAIALVQMRQGRFREAQDNYRRAAEFDPLSAEKHASLAWCMLMTKDYDEAERAIDRAIMLDPKDPDYYADKLKLFASRTGDKAQMRAVLEEAYQHVDPVDLFSPALWDFDLMGGSLDSMVEGYIQRYRDTESPLAFYTNITMACLTAGDTERAATYADSVRQVLIPMLEKTPDNADLHAAMGMSLACIGDYDDAVKEGRKARELLSVDDCHW